MELSETYKKWILWLKAKKLYGLFMYDVGKMLIRENEARLAIRYNNTNTYGFVCFGGDIENYFPYLTVEKLEPINDKYQLEYLIYRLCPSYYKGNWGQIYNEYVEDTKKQILGRGLTRKIKRRTKPKANREDNSYSREQIENMEIKWFNKFQRFNNRNYRIR